MKGIRDCVKGSNIVRDCEKRRLGCEFFCEVGNGEVSLDVAKEEIRVFGRGVIEGMVKVVNNGFRPLEGNNFDGYFIKGENIMAPNYEGGFYLRR